MQLLMKDVSNQRKKPTVDSAGIDTYISTMWELSETLKIILQMATSNTNKSDKECDQFGDLCILLGQAKVRIKAKTSQTLFG